MSPFINSIFLYCNTMTELANPKRSYQVSTQTHFDNVAK